jgi:glycine oxidase
MDTKAEFDVIVVGAGIIGSLSAWRLAQEGYRVALVDAGQPGGQASNAAAGILSPSAEVDQAGPFWELTALSLEHYDQMVEELQEESGMEVDFRRSGVLQLPTLDDPGGERLHERYRWQSALNPRIRWLSPVEVAEVEPALANRHLPAIYAPEEAQVHAPKMVQAAVRAAIWRGVNVWSGTPVERLLLRQNGQVEGVQSSRGAIRAHVGVVLAAGAWTGILSHTIGLHLPVEPVRGQVLGLHHDGPFLRHIVFWGSRYLCPKPDGRLIAGATEDAVGFEGRTSLNGLWQVTQALAELGLPMENLVFERAWAGLRPKVPDGLPVLGPVPGYPGLFLASGHHRNGILLSAITAELVKNWAAGRDLTPWTTFSPGRLLHR